MKKHNFSAGPSILPQEVLQKASEAVLNFNNSGLSLIEVSHRGKDFVEIMNSARILVKKLMNVGDDYEVLFLQGGATLQFSMIPYNLLKDSGKAGYTETGTWAKGAIKEAQKVGNTEILASSKDRNFSYIPKVDFVGSEFDYFHCTSNNTIYGTQMFEFPTCETPLVCDMSSDIFSRELDFTKFDLIYAGAQKNMGPAGTTLVVVKKDILGKTDRNLPLYFDYQQHIEKESMLNTPAVFAVYTSYLTLQWLEKNGGIAGAEQRNIAKAKILYDEIDRNEIFEGFCEKEDRSLMNVCFRLKDENLSQKFEENAKEAGISGILGHRSVGGYRASLYNAMPIESVQILVDVMKAL